MKDYCKCKGCGGTGKKPISAHLQRVMKVLRSRIESTTDEVSRIIEQDSQGKYKLSPSAVNNALVRLIEIGLATREVDENRGGNAYVYQAVDYGESQ